MFYWFYRTTHPDGYLNRPIVLWLQGGPGLSGTGLGNFLMFGPLDQNLEPRNSTWIQTANILFVDNPVGVGFSLVDNSSFIPKTTEEISTDLITMLQTFMNEHSYFKNNSFYIFGQSYGGKMAAALTNYLHKAIQKGEIQCNLKGVGIGNGYVSSLDFTVTMAPMVYHMSLIDDVQFKELDKLAWDAYRAAESGNWTGFRWYEDYFKMGLYFSITPDMSIYNILELNSEMSIYGVDIAEFMNGPVKEKLGMIPDDKHYDLIEGYSNTADAFIDRDEPVWNLVDEVLKESDIDVVIYSGQLDIACNTAGALRWINKLTWKGKNDFDMAERKMLTNPDTDVPEMFVKSYDNLKFYWVLNSGHVVPTGVPDVALRMLNRVLDDTD